MHGHTTPRAAATNPIAARIAELSEEFLVAGPARRDEIGSEVVGLMSGQIVPFDAR